MVENTKEAAQTRRNAGGTSCGAQRTDLEGPGGGAAGLGSPLFSGGGADGDADTWGLCPFALGCVAACGPGPAGIAALLGAGAGALLFLDFSSALPFLAAAVLIFTTAAAFQGLKLLEGPLFHPLAGAGLFLAVSGIYVLQSLSPLRAIRISICWWGSPPGTTSRCSGADRSGRIRTGCCSWRGPWPLALGDVELAGLSVGRALLCLLLLCAAFQRGAMAGAAAGLGGGLAADLCAGAGGVPLWRGLRPGGAAGGLPERPPGLDTR